MSLITSERNTYEEMWGVESYAAHSPGEMFVPVFLDMVPPTIMTKSSILDAGCGSGKGAIALEKAGFAVKCCDLTSAGLIPEASHLPFVETNLWDNLTKKVGFTDWVYCCDVLEHIPTEFTMLTVSRLLDVARKGLFLSISLVPDQNGVWVGRPLHLTVQPFVWWRDNLSTLGTVVEGRDLITSAAFLVTPHA